MPSWKTRFYALYHLAVYRGPRRGEILALRWDDMDLDTATMCISRNVVLVGGKAVEGTPKSEFSRRTIALDQSTVKVLRAQNAQGMSGRVDRYCRNVADEKLAASRVDDLQTRIGGHLTSGVEHVNDAHAEDSTTFVQLPGVFNQLLTDEFTGRPCRRWQ
jgi:integrase